MSVGIFLALHIVVVFWDPLCAWGVNQLRYYSIGWVMLAFVASALILRRRSRDRAIEWISNFRINPWNSKTEFRSFTIGLSLLSLVLFGIFRSAIHLLGDGYLLLRDLEYFDPETSWEGVNAPLIYWSVKQLHRLGGSIWESPIVSYRLYSMACGAAYFGLCPTAARVLGRSGTERTVILGFLITPGVLQLFFGYIETYALLMPFILLYLILGVEVIQESRSCLLPSLTLGALMAMHFAMLSLVPSLLFLVWTHYRSTAQPDLSRLRSGMGLIGILTLSPVVSILLLGIIGFDPVNYLASSKITHLLPVTGEISFHQNYRMLSVEHLQDIFNQFLLIAPAALLVMTILGRTAFRQQPTHLFLLTTTVFSFVFSFVANPEIGAFRDWDVFSFPGLPMTLWAGVALAGALQDEAQLKYAGFLVVASAFLHTGLWVGVNSRVTRAEARYTDVMTRGSLSGNARSYGWETFAIYLRESGRNEQAAEAYQRAIEASPENPRHWISLGNRYLALDRFQDAIDALEKAFELAPAYSETYSKNLANAHASLGSVHYRSGEVRKAIVEYKAALEANPNEVDVHFNLGVAYSRLGEHEAAIARYRRAIQLSPDYSLAYLNMGNSYSDLKQVREAVVQYRKAIETDPGYLNAHYNLALAQLELGAKEEARTGFLKVLELDGDYQKAVAIKSWLEQNP